MGCQIVIFLVKDYLTVLVNNTACKCYKTKTKQPLRGALQKLWFCTHSQNSKKLEK